MTLAVGTKFTLDGKSYRVHRTPVEDKLALKFCDKRCAFHNNQAYCRKILKLTGDCQPRYRTDNLPVHFREINNEK